MFCVIAAVAIVNGSAPVIKLSASAAALESRPFPAGSSLTVELDSVSSRTCLNGHRALRRSTNSLFTEESSRALNQDFRLIQQTAKDYDRGGSNNHGSGDCQIIF